MEERVDEKKATCEDDERMTELKSREIGEDGIVKRKVVAERRSSWACTVANFHSKIWKRRASRQGKEGNAKTMKARRKIEIMRGA